MALPTSRSVREFNKFVEDLAGNVAIRVIATDASGADMLKLEDTAHATGDPGIQMLAVRNDTLAALAGTDGDYAPIQANANGAVYVEVASQANLRATQTDTLLSHQGLTHPASVQGTAIDSTGLLSGTLFIYHANVEVTANATGVSYHFQGSHATSGNEDWITIAEFVTGTTAAETEALTATEPAAETTIAVASTTNLNTTGQIIYIQDAGTLADSEWAMIEDFVTNTSVELIDGLTNAKDNADFLWSQAEVFSFNVSDFSGYSRVRVIVNHEAATGANIQFKSVLHSITNN